MNENKFNGMGKVYAQFRPSYPQAFIDYLISKVGINPDAVLADIGSGTGKLTRQLLEIGSRVFAVEPNADMREIAERDLSPFENFISVSASAENTALPNESVDFITAAQAFHWFDKQLFKNECKRILKANGKVILVWNSREEESRFVQKNDEINRKYCPNFMGFSGGMRGTDDNAFSEFFCGEYETVNFDNPLRFDENGFIGRNLSSSYALKEKDENYSEYLQALKSLFDEYRSGDYVVMPTKTCCYIGMV